jgi:hypothetical protein
MYVRILSYLVITVLCSVALVEAQEHSRGFSVVLVLGESQGSTTATKMSGPAARALDDVKELLPYKIFQVLDTLWMAGGKSSIGRLRGSGGQEYDITLEVERDNNVFDVRLRLDEPGAAPGILDIAKSRMIGVLEQQRSAIERQLAQTRDQANPDRQALEQRLANVRKQIALARAMRLIDSRFEMTSGETVVVGTSRLRDSDKALIVLLTALR